MIEHGSIDGRSATAVTGAGGAAAKIFGRTSQSIAGSVKHAETPAPAPSAPSSEVAPEPEHRNEPRNLAAIDLTPPAPVIKPDLSAITVGMDRADLIRVAGKPLMSVSGIEGSVLVETYWYRVGADTATVVLRGGKIASITGIEKLAAKP